MMQAWLLLITTASKKEAGTSPYHRSSIPLFSTCSLLVSSKPFPKIVQQSNYWLTHSIPCGLL